MRDLSFFKIEINNKSHQDKWRVFFFWPKEFTFVCPIEIAEFGRLNTEFSERDAILLGGSTDSEYVHLVHKQELVEFPLG